MRRLIFKGLALLNLFGSVMGISPLVFAGNGKSDKICGNELSGGAPQRLSVEEAVGEDFYRRAHVFSVSLHPQFDESENLELFDSIYKKIVNILNSEKEKNNIYTSYAGAFTIFFSHSLQRSEIDRMISRLQNEIPEVESIRPDMLL